MENAGLERTGTSYVGPWEARRHNQRSSRIRSKMYTVQIGKHSSQAKKLLMAARHQREARFALRYQTHLTVDRLTAAAVALTVAEPASALAWLLYASLPIHMNDVPVFSSPASYTPAIRSHVFQSCVFNSRVFSRPLPPPAAAAVPRKSTSIYCA